MDTSAPNIVFDAQGVCEYCNNFKQEIKPNWQTDARGENELAAIAEKSKRRARAKTLTASLV